MRGIFVTATDTDIGKTVLTGAMAAALTVRGLKVGVFKPLASGALWDADGTLKSEDATFLMQAAGIPEQLRSEVNEVCLEPALTPAVAAKMSSVAIDLPGVICRLKKNAAKYDCVFIEGVGGILSPLWESYLIADLILALDLPAVIVSGAGLGTVNHTGLTTAYAKSKNIQCKGVILNRYQHETAGVLETSNQEYIERLTKTPVIGKFPIVKRQDLQPVDQFKLARLAETYIEIDKIIEFAGEKQ